MSDAFLGLLCFMAFAASVAVPLVLDALFAGEREMRRGADERVARRVVGGTKFAATWAGGTLTLFVPFALTAAVENLRSWERGYSAQQWVPLVVSWLMGLSGLVSSLLVFASSWRLVRRESSAPIFARRVAWLSHAHHASVFILWAWMASVVDGGDVPVDLVLVPVGVCCLIGIGAGLALRSAGIAAEAYARKPTAGEAPP